jgi:hypothetical protein
LATRIALSPAAREIKFPSVATEKPSMEVQVRSATLLSSIEERFAFLEARGFRLEQSTESPPCAWYRDGDRTVVIAYDPAEDAAIAVRLCMGRETFGLWDLFALSSDGARLEGVRERALIEAELQRAASLVETSCEDFLSGDLEAFRLNRREPLLVARLRAMARDEFWNGDLRRALELFELYRAYWDANDRTYHARLVSGEGRSAHLRSAMAR